MWVEECYRSSSFLRSLLKGDMMQECDLYPPVKKYFASLGYEVKGEVKNCDVVAIKDDTEVIIIELKLTFSLDLVLQGVNRKGLGDNVYMAVPAADTPGKRKIWKTKRRNILKLCKMLGMGLITVHMHQKNQKVEVLVDPAPYRPRINKNNQVRLIKEFKSRKGDPNTGGITRQKIITAYRQDALRCAYILKGKESMKLSDIKNNLDMKKAGSILLKNYYGWFTRLERGIYALNETGNEALDDYKNVVNDLK